MLSHPKSLFNIFTLLTLLASLLITMPATPVHAASFSVSTAAGLISAINTANANAADDTITLTANITLISVNNGSNGLPVIGSDSGHSLTIDGGSFTISRSTAGGTPSFRIFEVGSGADLTLYDLTISNGSAGSGGGIYNSGTLDITDSTFINNFVVSATSPIGGAIYSTGNIVIANSTFKGNSATGTVAGVGGAGGAIYVGGGQLNVTDSTFSSNGAYGGNCPATCAESGTGGVNIAGGSGHSISSSTFSGNTFTPGTGGGTGYSAGALYTAATLNLSNTILANSGTFADCIDINNMVSGSHNLIESDGGFNWDCGGVTVTSDPQLSPLADNGGLTQTMALGASSLAIDAGNCPSVLTDQRGVARPQDGDGNNTVVCDIGAYEVPDIVAPTVTVNQASGQLDPTNASPINFTVIFSEPITGFAAGDVTLNGTASATTAIVTEITPNNGTTYNIAISGMTSAGTVTASILAGAAQDFGSNPNTASTSVDNSVTYNPFAPTVISIVRASVNPTNASSVEFAVTFSESVTGVDASDFALTIIGVTGASITNVSGSGAIYTVTVNTGAHNGTIRLDVADDDSIKDAASNPLGGVGAGNGNYVSGETYNIYRIDTTGVFRPSNGLLYLKNSNTTGFADVAINYGMGGDYPVVGDWDGNGTATIGIYRNGSFYLRNSNTLGFADLVFAFGQPGDQPVAGDWDGDGVDTIGIFRTSTGQFLLRNSNTSGLPDASFYLGNVGDVGIAGDWNGDGTDTTGVFRPSNGVIFLKDTNTTGFAYVALNYGLPGDQPVIGDWNRDGIDTIGVYRNGQFLLRNSNTLGFADISFYLGNPGDMPIAGDWDGLP